MPKQIRRFLGISLTFAFAVTLLDAPAVNAATTLATNNSSTVVPSPPVNLNLVSKTQTSLSIEWSAPSDGAQSITDYVIQYSIDYGSTWVTFVESVSSNTSTTITGLTRGSPYQVRVKAVNSVGESKPSAVMGSHQKDRLSSGDNHSCAVMMNGTVKCWGLNDRGQLGDGTTTNKPTPTPVSGLTDVTSISLGNNHSCAVITDGTVKCWGLNDNGQLGDGTTTTKLTPTSITGLTNVASISLGRNHSCAVITDGTVKCWGLNDNGQLGDGTTTNRLTPTSVLRNIGFGSISSLTGVTSISLGETHSCALGTDGTVWCWGNNDSGQLGKLGDGIPLQALNPISLAKFSTAISISSGNNHSCVVASGDIATTLWCWGNNFSGQLGDGSYSFRTSPVRVNESGTSLSLGSDHGCFARGTVSCWGSSYLGDNSADYRATPVKVVAISNAATVASGLDHSCAALIDGNVRCWGDNLYGSLGDGTSIRSSLTPNLPILLSDRLWISLIPGSAPDAPLLTTISKDSTSVSLSWTEPNEGITDYEVQYSSNDGATWITYRDFVSSANSVTVKGLVSLTPYIFRVAAISLSGKSIFSLPSSTVIPSGLPSAPIALTLVSVNADSLSLSWQPPISDGGFPVTDYILEYINSGGTWTQFNDGISNQTMATISGLTQGTLYWVRVRAVNSEGTSVASEETSDVINATPSIAPTSVTNLTVTGTTKSSITLAWSAPLDNGGIAPTDYVIQYATQTSDNTAWITYPDGISTNLGITVSELLSDTTYRFRVAAVNPGGISDFLELANAVSTVMPPTPPLQLQLASFTDSSLSVSWTAPADSGGRPVTDYKIEYSSNAGLSWSVFDDGISIETSAIVNNLVRGITYQVRVRAINSAGESSPSSSFSGVKSIHSGNNFSCLIVSDGTVKCWGLNTSGQLGDGTNYGPRLLPTTVTNLSGAVSLALGESHACALLSNGTVKCWGDNTYGQLGDGTKTNRTIPVTVSGLTGVSSLADSHYGASRSCATLINGSVKCWGANWAGQLGNGTKVDSSIPVSVIGLQATNSIYIYQSKTCALLTVGSVRCWGEGISGLNRVRSAETGSVLSDVIRISGQNLEHSDGSRSWLYGPFSYSSKASSSSNGWYNAEGFGCELLKNSTVQCMGTNNSGQLGSGASFHHYQTTTPTAVRGLTKVVSISVGASHTCALNSDSTVSCWGKNDSFQLGSGMFSLGESIPKTIPSSFNVNNAIPSELPTEPLSVNVLSQSSGSRSLQWTAPSDNGGQQVTNYEIRYSIDHGQSWTGINRSVSPLTTATVSVPNATGEYFFQVRAVTPVGNGPWSEASISLNEKSGSMLNVSWLPPMANASSVDEYVVERSVDNGATWIMAATHSSLVRLASISGLTRGTSYVIRVRALDNQDQILATYSTTAMTATLPSAPTKPVTTVTSGTSVQLAWTAGADSGLPNNDYKIEFSSDNGSTWVLFDDGVDSGLLKNVTGLVRGNSYVFRISAVSTEGEGEKSPTSNAAIPATAPAAPTAPTITSQSSDSIGISWVAPDNGGRPITSYIVYRCSSSGTCGNASVLPRAATSTTATITGLSNGTDYRFSIVAVNAQGQSSLSTLSSIAMAGNPPSAVSNLRQTSGTNSSVSLAWNNATTSAGSILSYETQYSIDGLTWVTCSTGCGGLNTTATISSLANAQGYFFRVRANSSTGWSSYTQIQAATKGVKPQTISILTSTGDPVTSGAVSWTLTDGTNASSSSRSPDSSGKVNFEWVATGSASVTISQGLVSSGARVSGTWTTVLGMSNLELRLPVEPVITERVVTVQLPNGIPVPDSRIVAQSAIASSRNVSSFTFEAPGTLNTFTNGLGQATLMGYTTGSPSVQVTYDDTVLVQRKTATLSSPSTNITLEYMPWVSAPEVNKAVDYGTSDLVAFRVNTVQESQSLSTSGLLSGLRNFVTDGTESDSSLQAGVLVQIQRPAGAPFAPPSCNELLSARTNSSGIAILRICPTMSGEYKVVTVGAVASKPLRYTVNVPVAPAPAPVAAPAPQAAPAAPQLGLKARVSAGAVAAQLGIAVPPKAKVTLKVSGASKKVCRVSGGRLVTLKPGNCSVSVTVQPAKQKGMKKKPAPIRASRVITIK